MPDFSHIFGIRPWEMGRLRPQQVYAHRRYLEQLTPVDVAAGGKP
jgi:hypothetical protein